MATAHGQLHMTGNCITLSSFCECQGEARGKRKGEGGIALAAATKCAHSAHHKGVRVRERGDGERQNLPYSFASFLHSSSSPALLCSSLKLLWHLVVVVSFVVANGKYVNVVAFLSPHVLLPPCRALIRTVAPSRSNLWVVRALSFHLELLSLVQCASISPFRPNRLFSTFTSVPLPPHPRIPHPVSRAFPLLLQSCSSYNINHTNIAT